MITITTLKIILRRKETISRHTEVTHIQLLLLIKIIGIKIIFP
jgi:hypothetical protein